MVTIQEITKHANSNFVTKSEVMKS